MDWQNPWRCLYRKQYNGSLTVNFVLIAFVINQESQLLYSAIHAVTTVTLHENITYLLSVKMPTISGSNCAELWSQTSYKEGTLANHTNICSGDKAKGFWQTTLWGFFLFVVFCTEREEGMQISSVGCYCWSSSLGTRRDQILCILSIYSLAKRVKASV